MKTIFRIALFAFLTIVPTSVKAADGVSYAFLVAIGGYDTTELVELPYTVSEMREFRDVLLASGYESSNIKLLCDGAERRYLPERKKIVDELKLMIARLGKDDSILVAINGHGLHFVGDKTGFFCPIDAQVEDKSTMIPIDTDDKGQPGLFPLLKNCQAQRKLLLVNACRNDPLSNRSQASKKVRLDDVESESVPAGIAMLSACGPGQKSYFYDADDDRTKGRNRSLFFHHVIETWKSRGSDVTVDDLFTKVVREVSTDADNLYGKQQIPLKRREYQGEGEWYLRGKLKRTEPIAPAFPYSASQAQTYQAEYASFVSCSVVQTNSIGLQLTLIPPGEFMMGTDETEAQLEAAGFVLMFHIAHESPRHRIRISSAFVMGTKEVTVGQFRRFVDATGTKTEAETDGKGGWGYNPSTQFPEQETEYSWRSTGFAQSDDHPVVNVTWNDAIAFCKWLSKQDGREYRLPTEAEWEYTCRAGTRTRYFSGDTSASLSGNGNFQDAEFEKKFPKIDFKFYTSLPFSDGFAFTSPAGRFRPNGFGLYDMHGNVWEWCNDLYDSKYYASSKQTDPPGSTQGSYRVYRGGSWRDDAAHVRSSFRYENAPEYRYYGLGFRVASSSVQ